MHAYLLFAHPNPYSLNGKLRDAAIEGLTSQGYTVRVHDLYASGFKAVADIDDFMFLSNEQYFDLQKEQEFAVRKDNFTDDIRQEQAELLKADLLVIQFPMWWYSMPAILKGYFDRVFAYGFAYGTGKALAGKKVLVCSTVGAPSFFWQPGERGTVPDIYRHLLMGTLAFCGMQVYEPYIVHGSKRLTDAQRDHILAEYAAIIRQLDQRPLVDFQR